MSEIHPLITTLSALAQKDNNDIVIVIDGSASITEQDFSNVIKFCLRAMLTRFKLSVQSDQNNNTTCNRIALVQFSDTVKVEMNLSNSRFELNVAINRMIQLKQCTRTDLGIETAGILLVNSGNPTSTKTIIVLTDGGSSIPSATMDMATRAKDEYDIQIICIGIGQHINIDEVRGIASPTHNYVIENMQSLERIFRQFVVPPRSPPSLEMRSRRTNSIYLNILYNETKYDYFEVQKLKVDSQNALQYETAASIIPKRVQIRDLTPNTAYLMRVRVKYGTNAFSDWSDPVEFRTLQTTPDSRLVASELALEQALREKREFILNFRLTDLQQYMFKTLKICLVGQLGAGKSSVINSFRKALGLNGWTVATGSVGGHCTTRLCRDPLSENIDLFDTMGWTMTNYSGNGMEMLLKGRLPLHVDMSGDFGEFLLAPNTQHGDTSTTTGIDNTFPGIIKGIHAVIVCVDSGMVTDQSYTDRLKEFNTQMAKAGLTPFYLLTKMDKRDEDMMVDDLAEGLFESDSVRALMDLFCKVTALSRDSVLPIASYTDEQQIQDPYRDYVFLKVLESAIKKSLSQMQMSIQSNPAWVHRFHQTQNQQTQATTLTKIKLRPIGKSMNIVVKMPGTFIQLLEDLRTKFDNDDIFALLSEDKTTAFIDEICDQDIAENKFFWIATRQDVLAVQQEMEENHTTTTNNDTTESTEGAHTTTRVISGPMIVLQTVDEEKRVQIPLGDDLGDLLERASKALGKQIVQFWSENREDVMDEIDVMKEEPDGVLYYAVQEHERVE